MKLLAVFLLQGLHQKSTPTYLDLFSERWNKYVTTITMIKILQLTWPIVSGTVYAVWELGNLGHTQDTLPHQILFPLKI
jgi:hypothetical protein